MFGLCRCGDSSVAVAPTPPAPGGKVAQRQVELQASPRAILAEQQVGRAVAVQGGDGGPPEPEKEKNAREGESSALRDVDAKAISTHSSSRTAGSSGAGGAAEMPGQESQLFSKKHSLQGLLRRNAGNVQTEEASIGRRDTHSMLIQAVQSLLMIQAKFTRDGYYGENASATDDGREAEGDDSLQQLLTVPREPGEKRDKQLAQISDSLQREAGVGIFILHLADMDPVKRLGMLIYLRCGFRLLAREMGGVSIVKAEDERIFAVSQQPAALLSIALAFQNLCDTFSQAHPGLEASCSAGLEWGKVVLLPGDYFGNPVNVASKLGEDNAEPGDLNVASFFMDKLRGLESQQDLAACITTEKRNAVVSKVSLDFFLTKLDATVDLSSLLPKSKLPSDAEVLKFLYDTAGKSKHGEKLLQSVSCLEIDMESSKAPSMGAALQAQTCAMLQSDMSGFTRLTKKYGIMHFLCLVWNCRRIYAEALDEYKGKILKYDGDNVITVFDDALSAAQLAAEVMQRADAYNKGLDQDYQIRLKFGLSFGSVFICKPDIAGKSWDDCCLLGEETAKVGEILVTREVRESILANANTGINMTFEEVTVPRPNDDDEPLTAYKMIPAIA